LGFLTIFLDGFLFGASITQRPPPFSQGPSLFVFIVD
jgi:hypothetical protein